MLTYTVATTVTKSTLLAWLALAGHDVLSDDLLVLADGAVAAGPRCLDLSADVGQRVGASKREVL